MLQLDAVVVDYGGSLALRGFSARIGVGEVVSLIGANGAGKSTTLNAICGLIRPKSGTIRFKGEVINGLRPREIVLRGIAQVPEGRRVFGPLSIHDNLLMGALYSTRGERQAALDDVYALFPELKTIRHRAAGALSGGQQQMLAIGRALMMRPSLLLLDEPSLGLAPVVVDRVANLVLALKHRGMSILLVEQNAHLALDLSDRAYVLEQGESTIQGNSADLARSDRVREAFLGVAPVL